MTVIEDAKDATIARQKQPSPDQPSLRTWLADLEAAGQLRRITAKVDWDEEMAAVARINLALGESGGAPQPPISNNISNA